MESVFVNVLYHYVIMHFNNNYNQSAILKEHTEITILKKNCMHYYLM